MTAMNSQKLQGNFDFSRTCWNSSALFFPWATCIGAKEHNLQIKAAAVGAN